MDYATVKKTAACIAGGGHMAPELREILAKTKVRKWILLTKCYLSNFLCVCSTLFRSYDNIRSLYRTRRYSIQGKQGQQAVHLEKISINK